jgi:hypothetical protein
VTPKPQATEAKLNPTKGKNISEKAKQSKKNVSNHVSDRGAISKGTHPIQQKSGFNSKKTVGAVAQW